MALVVVVICTLIVILLFKWVMRYRFREQLRYERNIQTGGGDLSKVSQEERMSWSDDPLKIDSKYSSRLRQERIQKRYLAQRDKKS